MFGVGKRFVSFSAVVYTFFSTMSDCGRVGGSLRRTSGYITSLSPPPSFSNIYMTLYLHLLLLFCMTYLQNYIIIIPLWMYFS
jgi:hypothetical protein